MKTILRATMAAEVPVDRPTVFLAERRAFGCAWAGHHGEIPDAWFVVVLPSGGRQGMCADCHRTHGDRPDSAWWSSVAR